MGRITPNFTLVVPTLGVHVAKSFDFKIAGVNDLISKFKEMGPEMLQAGAASMYRSAEDVMTTSKEVYVPIDTGALKSSGTVQMEIKDEDVIVTLGYGSAAAPYAVFVHEINKHYRGGRQWKYLETPLKAKTGDIERALRNDLTAKARAL